MGPARRRAARAAPSSSARSGARSAGPAAFATPFSKADPLGTPNGLATDRVDVPAAIRAAVQDLQAKGIALDVPLGELQYELRGDERLPMSGCPDLEGCFNILTSRRDEQGVYQPYTGSSFVMAAELTDERPARPARSCATRSPRTRARAHFADQTRLYAQERWLPLRFTERADPDRPGVHAHAGDGSQVSRERPVAVGMVLAAAGSLQVGAAFAITLFDELGPGGAAFLRLAFAAVVLWAIWRPALQGDLRLAAAFGVALGLMNWSIYESIARIPLGVAVTIEFAGPLLVAVIGSRRPLDGVWVALAAAGILLLADPAGGSIDGLGVLFALLAAACWMAYIHLSKRTGEAFPGGVGAGARDGGRRAGRAPRRASPRARARWRSRTCSALRWSSRWPPRCCPTRSSSRRCGGCPAAVFGVLMSLEPAVAALAGFVVLGQDLGARELVAIALVVVASAGCGGALSAALTPSSQSRSETWRSECSPERELVAQLAQQPEAVGDDVVLVDRLEVLLARRDERVVAQLGQPLDDAADHLAHAVLDEARPAVGLLDHRALVGALHQLVDLRRHRVLDDRQQPLGVDVGVAVLRAADVQRAEPALVVRRDRHGLEDPLDLALAEAVREQPLARARLHERLRARAGGHALRGHADRAASCRPRRRPRCRAACRSPACGCR